MNEHQIRHLRFLRNTVLPHLKEMPTIDECAIGVEIENKEEWEHFYEFGETDMACDLDIDYIVEPEVKRDRAIFNLNTYISNTRTNENPVSDKYNCGREGCLAGWYAILGKELQSDHLPFLSLTEQGQVGSYDISMLSHHFGILRTETNNLFGSLGKGIEGFPSDHFDENGEGDTSHDLNKDALEARAQYLDKLFERYSISHE